MSYRRGSIVALMLTTFLWSGCAELQSMGGTNALMSLLSQQLGLTTNQATGGTGSVLSLAKEKLPSGDFSSLSKLIPGSDSLMQSAKDLGAVTGPVKDKAGLEAAFSRLGMGNEMVPKFLQIMSDFVGKTGGESAKNLLAMVMQ